MPVRERPRQRTCSGWVRGGGGSGSGMGHISLRNGMRKGGVSMVGRWVMGVACEGGVNGPRRKSRSLDESC